MEIDVVIPLFNGRKWIAQTLDAVFAQTRKPAQVIVVDDSSTDRGWEIAARYPRVTLLQNPARGTSRARNLGFRHTTAPLIAFLDQDDLWHPEHLRFLTEALAVRPWCSYAVAKHRDFKDDETPFFSIEDRRVVEIDPWDEYPRYGFAATVGTSLFPRDRLIAAGLWNPEHDGMSDHSLWLRAALRGPVAVSCARTLAYRKHPGSHWNVLRRSPEKYFTLMLKVYDDLRADYCASTAPAGRKREICRRNRLIHDVIDVVSALRAGNDRALAAALESFNGNLLTEPLMIWHVMTNTLVSLLRLACSGTAAYEASYLTILNAWPGPFEGPKKIMVYTLNDFAPGIGFYLHYLVRKPWDPSRMYPLAVKTIGAVRRFARERYAAPAS